MGGGTGGAVVGGGGTNVVGGALGTAVPVVVCAGLVACEVVVPVVPVVLMPPYAPLYSY